MIKARFLWCYNRQFTLVELVVSISIFTFIVYIAYQILFSAQQSFQQQILIQKLEFQKLQIMEQLNREFLGIANKKEPRISGVTFPAVPGFPLPPSFLSRYPNAVSLITYSKITGWDSSEDENALPPTPGPIFAPATTYFFSPSQGEIDNNNIDDNHNGLVDEGDLYKLYDNGTGYTVQLVCHHLKKRLPSGQTKSVAFSPDPLSGIRLHFDEVHSTITFEITLQKRGQDQRLYSTTAYSIITLRNF